MTSLIVWIFGAAVAQGLFLLTALAPMPARNSRARWLLVGLVGVFTLMLTEEFLDVAGFPPGLGVGLAAEFAVAPLLFFFVESLAEDRPPPHRRACAHFIPLGLAVLWLAALFAAAPQNWVSLDNDRVRHWIAATVGVKAAYIGVYGVAILRRPLGLAGKPAATVSALRWVRRWLWFFFSAYAVGVLSFLAFYLRLPGAIDSDYVGAFLLVAALYSLAYFALANRHVFDRKPRPETAPGASELVARARAVLIEADAFLDPELSLRRLALTLEVSESALSEALNADIPGGFYALLNACRLDAFEALAQRPDRRDRTVLELALEAGFNSKATFYRVLKARHGLTPRQYRERLSRPGVASSGETSPIGA
jgi:AraC-like DNA-binding protein